MTLLALVALLSAPPAEPPGGALEGTVLDSLTGQPVEGVEVSVVPQEGLRPGSSSYRRVKTDLRGSFRFDSLPLGGYVVNYRKTAYAGTDYGVARPRRVRLSDAEPVQLRLVIEPTATLSGRVLDEDGKPLSGVWIYARHGSRASPVSDETNSAGEFSLDYLAAGRYTLQIRVPAGLRRKTLRVTDGEMLGYFPAQFYPGVREQELASPVALAPGQQLRGFDLRLRRARLTTIRGVATDAVTREPAAGVEVELRDDADPDYETQHADAAGRFRFELAPPGPCWLALYRGDAKKSLPLLVAVNAAPPLEEVFITVPPFGALRGRVARPAVAGPPSLFSVLVSPAAFGSLGRSLDVQPDGSFDIALPPGSWRVSVVQMPSPFAGAEDLYVSAIRFGDQDALAAPIAVTEGANPTLEVVLAKGARRISGQVLDERDQPVAGVLVRATAPSRPPVSVFTGDDGSFQLRGLAPAEYRVAAGDCAPGADKLDLASADLNVVSLRLCAAR